MSSTSSNPDDGDTTEQSQLGLDTVIKVSEVAVPSVTPGEQVLRALLDRTLPGAWSAVAPRPSGARSTCACAQWEYERASADLQTGAAAQEASIPLELRACSLPSKVEGTGGPTVLVGRYGNSCV